jgi:ATP-dependent RNA helicase SUPV3L1/SUV3
LRGLGVRIGAFSLHMPGLLRPDARAVAQAFAAREAPEWRPATEGPAPVPAAASPRALAGYGRMAVGGLAVPVAQLEQLDELLRATPKAAGAVVLSDEAREALGWTQAEARAILRGLGFAPAARPKPGEPIAWRRRRAPEPARAPAPARHSPFAALAALQAEPAPSRRVRRRRKPGARARAAPGTA